MLTKIILGISSCLLGEKVRFDGGHKLDRFKTETLGKYVEFVPVCPEVECGLKIPREAMQQRLIVLLSGHHFCYLLKIAHHKIPFHLNFD